MVRLLESLRGRTTALFAVAGSLLLIFGALLGAEAATELSAPEDIFGPLGYAVAAIGLLGLHQKLVDEHRGLVNVAAVAALLALVGWGLLTVLSVLEVAGLVESVEETVLGGIGLAGSGVGMILGYPLFAIATLRSASHSRAVGLLLLAPTVIFLAVFVVLAPLIGDDGAWGPFVAGTLQAVAHLAVAFALLREAQLRVPADA